MLVTTVALLAISACTSTATLEKQIYAADQGVTAVVSGADAALNAKLITAKQARSVSYIAHQVVPLLDSARAANEASDTAGATKTMALVNTLLESLQAYVATPAAK